METANPVLDFDPRRDPAGARALEHLPERAGEAFGLALHHQPDHGPEAVREALRAALGSVAPGFAAAALHRVAREPALDLTDEQREALTDRATDIDPGVTEDLTGSDARW